MKTINKLNLILGILFTVLTLGLSALSFLFRSNIISLKGFVSYIVEIYHNVTFAITKLIINNIPFLDLTVTKTNSDALWLFLMIMLPPLIILAQIKEKTLIADIIWKTIYLAVGIGLLYVFIFKLFDENIALAMDRSSDFRNELLYIFIKNGAITQIPLVVALFGTYGATIQRKAFATYRNISIALLIICGFYLTGFIEITSL